MEVNSLFVIGIDEAGRGPLAGPVAVGAVMIPQASYAETLALFQDVRDSKKLSEKKRELMYERMAAARAEKKLFFNGVPGGVYLLELKIGENIVRRKITIED